MLTEMYANSNDLSVEERPVHIKYPTCDKSIEHDGYPISFSRQPELFQMGHNRLALAERSQICDIIELVALALNPHIAPHDQGSRTASEGASRGWGPTQRESTP